MLTRTQTYLNSQIVTVAIKTNMPNVLLLANLHFFWQNPSRIMFLMKKRKSTQIATIHKQSPRGRVLSFEEFSNLLQIFPHSNFLTYKISKKGGIAIASIVRLDNLSLTLQTITLRLITQLIFKYKSPQSSTTIYTDQCTDRWC